VWIQYRYRTLLKRVKFFTQITWILNAVISERVTGERVADPVIANVCGLKYRFPFLLLSRDDIFLIVEYPLFVIFTKAIPRNTNAFHENVFY
jgi:hypothetical protein